MFHLKIQRQNIYFSSEKLFHVQKEQLECTHTIWMTWTYTTFCPYRLHLFDANGAFYLR